MTPDLLVGPLLILGAALLAIPLSAPVWHVVRARLEEPPGASPHLRVRCRAVVVADVIDEATGEALLRGEHEEIARAIAQPKNQGEGRGFATVDAHGPMFQYGDVPGASVRARRVIRNEERRDKAPGLRRPLVHMRRTENGYAHQRRVRVLQRDSSARA